MKRFKNILFVHGLGQNEAAMSCAVALAKDNQAKLTVIKICEQPTNVDFAVSAETANEVRRALSDDYHQQLEQLVDPFRDQAKIEIRVLEGKSFLTIIREVLANQHDLLVKGADGSENLTSHLFSTTDMNLLRMCPCPVWLAKPNKRDKIERIVAAVDLGEPGEDEENHALNKQILEMAISLAYRQGAELHVVHAWRAIAEHVLSPARSGLSRDKVDAYIAEVEESHISRLSHLIELAKTWVDIDIFEAVKPQIHAIKGRAEVVIEQQIQTLDAQVLVMGTVGRTGIPGFFIGNTAETILNHIECAVLAIKPAGFLTPVELPNTKD